MRETQAAKEQSKPRQLIQACLHLLLYRAGNQELLPQREEFPSGMSLGVSARQVCPFSDTDVCWSFCVENGKRQRGIRQTKARHPRSPMEGIKSQREGQAGNKKGPGMAGALRHKCKLLFSLTRHDLPESARNCRDFSRSRRRAARETRNVHPRGP